ncbi:MAG: hypothetical protein MZU79_02505 [Anaerotruncus sp.]|nr:hypothetical protein [Anaerotruncus sp.]
MKKLSAVAGLLLVAIARRRPDGHGPHGTPRRGAGQGQEREQARPHRLLLEWLRGLQTAGPAVLRQPQVRRFPQQEPHPLPGHAAATRTATPSTSGSTSARTPTELFVDKDGREVDWIVGYGPPPDKFLEKVRKSSGRRRHLPRPERALRQGAERTSRPSSSSPKSAAAAILAGDGGERSKELYEKVIALDPEGTTRAPTPTSILKASVPYTEAAALELGQAASLQGASPTRPRSRPSSRKYPAEPARSSRPIPTSATTIGMPGVQGRSGQVLSRNTRPSSPTTRTPSAPTSSASSGTGEPARQGHRPGREAPGDQPATPEHPEVQQNLAQLYVRKGDPAKADEEYGKDYVDGYVSGADPRPDRLRQASGSSRDKNLEQRRGHGRPRGERPSSGMSLRYYLSQVSASTSGWTRSTRPWPSTAPSSPRRAGTSRALRRATRPTGTGRARTSTAPSRPPNGPSN